MTQAERKCELISKLLQIWTPYDVEFFNNLIQEATVGYVSFMSESQLKELALFNNMSLFSEGEFYFYQDLIRKEDEKV